MATLGKVVTKLLTLLSLVVLLGSLTFPTLAKQSKTPAFQSNNFSITSITSPTEAYENQLITFTIAAHNNKQNASTWVNISLTIDSIYTNSSNQTIQLSTLTHNFTISWQAQHGLNATDERLLNFTVYAGFPDTNRSDNYKTAIITITPPQPDLTFTTPIRIIGERVIGKPLTLKATAKNQGKDTNQTIDITLLVNHGIQESQHLDGGLAYGETNNLSFTWTPSTIGAVILTISLDPNAAINETNETNNNLSVTITVSASRLPWWDLNWHYRILYNTTGTGNITEPLDFTACLGSLNITGQTFEDSTITVIKYTSTGKIIKVHPYHFTKTAGYDAVTHAIGNLTWQVNGTGIYAVYFDVTANPGSRSNGSAHALNASGTPTASTPSPSEGWWMTLQKALNIFYAPNHAFTISMKTTAKASSMKGALYLGSVYKKYQNFMNPDGDKVNWSCSLNLTKGNWTILISANDTAGYAAEDLMFPLNITTPDLAISFSSLPSSIAEKTTVTITAFAYAYNATIPNVDIRIKNNDTLLAQFSDLTISKGGNVSKSCYWVPIRLGKTKITVEINSSGFNESNPYNNYKSQTVTIVSAPDFGVVNITLPKNPLAEGASAVIQTAIRNSGHAKGTDYTVALCLEQHETPAMDYSIINQTILLTLNAGQTITVNFTWSPVHYGESTYHGKWYVGIKVWNSAAPDPNTDNNTLARLDHSINVTATDRTNPYVLVDNPGILELGHPAVITAKVTDPSGIKSVILTLTRPSQYVKSTYTMNTTDYVYYSYTVQNTSLLGIYDFTITATDASEFHNKTTVSQSFRIIEDQTPPSLNYTGALPFAQLAGGYVEIRCLTWDFSGLRSVTVKITAPGSTLLGYTLTMNKEGYYVLNYTYSTIGQYTYVVTSEDVYNNSRSSVPATFWITDDLNDTDNDGMPDVWERTNGFDPYNPADAVLDADHDGSTNLQEYREGTNPLQASVPSALAAFGDHAGYLTASVVLFAVILLLCVFLLRRRQP